MSDELFDELFEEEEEDLSFDSIFEEEEPEPPVRDRKLIPGYNDHGTDYSENLMYPAEAREILPDSWSDVQAVAKSLVSLGNIPFNTIRLDPDRFHLAIWAAERLRLEGDNTVYDQVLKEDKIRRGAPTKEEEEFVNTHQTKIDGEYWGYSPVLPIREQMAEKKQTQADNATVVPNEVFHNDNLDQIWEQAIKFARQDSETWVDQYGFEFESMIRWAKAQIKDQEVVPKPYPRDFKEIYWPLKPYDDTLAQAERREFVVEKVMRYLQKAFTMNRPDFSTDSYRVILAKEKLCNAIDKYVFNEIADIEDDIMKTVQIRTKEYYQSYFPLPGNPKGPKDVVEPNYVEYCRRCVKYGLTYGHFLQD